MAGRPRPAKNVTAASRTSRRAERRTALDCIVRRGASRQMPRTVAVIGASSNRRKFGNKAVRAFHAHGDTVFPVNPHEEVIEGLTAYPSVLAIPGTIDMATMYVPPAIGLAIL